MKNGTRALFALCAAFLLCLFSFPGAVQAQSQARCASDVVVQPGDSLMAIAERVFGEASAYARIVEATNARAEVDRSYATIDDPGFIRIGWKLCIPESTPVAAGLPQETASPDQSTEYFADLFAVAATDFYDAFDPAQIRELAVNSLRARSYLGSEIEVVDALPPGPNYVRNIVTYRSDGLLIYALMTVPMGERPSAGWPVIVFNRGYVPPEQYRPLQRYESYIDGFARSGYMVFVPDYRGHGNSEGQAAGYLAPDYTVDVLNAVAALKAYPPADGERIGLWGHSLGGNIVLRSMVISEDIRAGVIWSGVVAPVADLLTLIDLSPIAVPQRVLDLRQMLYDQFGSPQENPGFWDSISPNTYLTDLSGPIQLHHGTDDVVVPVVFSTIFDLQSSAAGQETELFTYSGDDHNLSANFDAAMARSVEFFDRHLKGELARAP